MVDLHAPVGGTVQLLAAPELTSREFLALTRQSPWRAFAIGSRTRSSDVLEVLTAEASSNKLTWAELETHLARTESRDDIIAYKVPALLAAAMLASVLNPTANSFQLVEKIMRLALDYTKLSTLAAGGALRFALHIATMTQSYALFRELSRFPRAQKMVRWAGETDFLRPRAPQEWLSDEQPSPQFQRWWAAFNQDFTRAGLDPFELDPAPYETGDSSELFASIVPPRVAPSSVAIAEQELVTVIVPTYNPGPSFLNTIESLTRQSWCNLEILVMDDRSTEGKQYLDASMSDPRVRVITMPVNGGAYRARNAGLAAAQGAYIAFQDADDTSHPNRIEWQLLPLRGRGNLVASVSHAQRVLGNGTLTYFGYLPQRVNASSLLFRREEVLARLGGFDAVRKGADSEFTERLLRAFGPDALHEVPQVLSLVQLSLGSLSRSDFRPHWMSGNRLSYLRQFKSMHQRIQHQPLPHWLLDEQRPAISWSSPGMNGRKAAPELDCAVLADWNQSSETPRDIASRALELLQNHAAPVGLLNGVLPRRSKLSREPVTQRITAEVEAGRLVWMNWLDVTHVKTLLIDEPEYLWCLPDANETGITVDEVIITLDSPLSGAPDSLPPIDWCESRVRDHFGVRPKWVVAAPEIYATLQQHGSEVTLLPTVAPAPLGTLPASAIGVVLPARTDLVKWRAERLAEHVPDHSGSRVAVYDELDLFDPSDFDLTNITYVSGTTCSRAEFLQAVDVLVPDLFGEHLRATESWMRLAAGSGVATALPREHVISLAPTFTYPLLGSRDILAALDSTALHVFQPPHAFSNPGLDRTTRRIRVLFHGADPATAARAIARLPKSFDDGIVDAHAIANLRPETLARAAVTEGLGTDDIVCLVPAETECDARMLSQLVASNDDLLSFPGHSPELAFAIKSYLLWAVIDQSSRGNEPASLFASAQAIAGTCALIDGFPAHVNAAMGTAHSTESTKGS